MSDERYPDDQAAALVPSAHAAAPPSPALLSAMRAATPARIGLGRAGTSIATRDQLEFQLAHAQARDAVQAPLDVNSLMDALRERGLACVALRSAIASSGDATADRRNYLRSPDLGRKLHPDSTALLRQAAAEWARAKKPEAKTADIGSIVFILADGLSALAVERHALLLIEALLPTVVAPVRIAPVCVVTQARVALGDQIGHILGAQLSVVLIGERPGLSSPASLGAYITWDPRPGRTDAERNCVSNIRPEGLGYTEAAQRIAHLIRESRRMRLSGVALKDASPALPEST